ncbi:MAG: hypothetical protein HY081_10855 [Gammaproteobacteria bacterium]|nr:hypothetical protein [Gammaproteobacteria bacterium]
MQEIDSLPGLEAVLARAESGAAESSTDYETRLFALFGLKQEKDADLPVAAVTRSLDMGVIDNDWWLRADPVHLSLDRDRLMLVDAQMLDISQQEANRLVAEIMEVFSADGWLLKAPRPDRWYLKTARPPQITTTPLSQAVAQDVHAFLPQGVEAKAWHTTLNEIQILLHTATVNAEREQRGQLPINSLWFWGGGRLPRLTALPWSQIWSNEPMSLALARLAGGVATTNAPASFAEWQEAGDKPGEHLVVLTDVHNARLYSDAARCTQAMHDLEKNWMEPLCQALKKNTLSQATLVGDGAKNFTLTARHARRWWRRRRSLAAYQTHLN